jgi:hypothetical protein
MARRTELPTFAGKCQQRLVSAFFTPDASASNQKNIWLVQEAIDRNVPISFNINGFLFQYDAV